MHKQPTHAPQTRDCNKVKPSIFRPIDVFVFFLSFSLVNAGITALNTMFWGKFFPFDFLPLPPAHKLLLFHGSSCAFAIVCGLFSTRGPAK